MPAFRVPTHGEITTRRAPVRGASRRAEIRPARSRLDRRPDSMTSVTSSGTWRATYSGHSRIRRSEVTRRWPASAVATISRSAGSAWKSASSTARLPISPSTGISTTPCSRCSRRHEPNVIGQPDASLVHEQGNLPERKSRKSRPPSKPQQGAGIEKDQWSSSRTLPVSASHTTSRGSSMSPRISNFPRSMPKRVSGFLR